MRVVRRDREWYRLETAARLASSLAALSTCRRLGVGCVVATPKLERVLAVGYNGPPAGLDNSSCSGEAGVCGCVHAEANALVKLSGDSGSGLTLHSTHSPCRHCAGLVVNSGRVSRVVYGTEFRDRSGVEVLRATGVECLVLSSILPREIVVGERANEEPTAREIDSADGWRRRLAAGAFRTAVAESKLASIGVDLSQARSVNLLPPSRSRDWDAREAAREAARGLADQPGIDWLVCGRRAWAALTGDESADFGDSREVADGRAILLPHPSGLSRWWNDSKNISRIRERLAAWRADERTPR